MRVWLKQDIKKQQRKCQTEVHLTTMSISLSELLSFLYWEMWLPQEIYYYSRDSVQDRNTLVFLPRRHWQSWHTDVELLHLGNTWVMTLEREAIKHFDNDLSLDWSPFCNTFAKKCKNNRRKCNHVALWERNWRLLWFDWLFQLDGALRTKSCLEVSLCSYRESQWSLLPAWVIYLRPVFPEPTWCQGTGTGMKSALHGTSGAERWAQRAAKTKRTKPTTRVSLVHSWPLRGQKKSIRNCT